MTHANPHAHIHMCPDKCACSNSEQAGNQLNDVLIGRRTNAKAEQFQNHPSPSVLAQLIPDWS